MIINKFMVSIISMLFLFPLILMMIFSQSASANFTGENFDSLSFFDPVTILSGWSLAGGGYAYGSNYHNSPMALRIITTSSTVVSYTGFYSDNDTSFGIRYDIWINSTATSGVFLGSVGQRSGGSGMGLYEAFWFASAYGKVNHIWFTDPNSHLAIIDTNVTLGVDAWYTVKFSYYMLGESLNGSAYVAVEVDSQGWAGWAYAPYNTPGIINITGFWCGFVEMSGYGDIWIDNILMGNASGNFTPSVPFTFLTSPPLNAYYGNNYTYYATVSETASMTSYVWNDSHPYNDYNGVYGTHWNINHTHLIYGQGGFKLYGNVTNETTFKFDGTLLLLSPINLSVSLCAISMSTGEHIYQNYTINYTIYGGGGDLGHWLEVAWANNTLIASREDNWSHAISGIISLLIVFIPAIALNLKFPKLGFIIGILIMVSILGISQSGFLYISVICYIGILVSFIRSR